MELAVVIVVIGILAAIAIALFGGIQQGAKRAVLIADLKNSSTAVETERGETGSYPSGFVPISSAGNELSYVQTGGGSGYCISGEILGSDPLVVKHVTHESGGIAADGDCSEATPLPHGIFVAQLDADRNDCTDPGLYLGGVTSETTIAWLGNEVEAVAGFNPTPGSGEFDVTIDGTFTRLGSESASAGTQMCLTGVSEWTTTGTTSIAYAFAESDIGNQIANPPSTVTDMSYAFYESTPQSSSYSAWTTPNVRTMESMFENTIGDQYGPLSWDVGNVENFSKFAKRAYQFAHPIGHWDVSSATDMSEMLSFAPSFTSDISDWDVSSVTTMRGMFSENPSYSGDLAGWDTGNVTDMSGMFKQAYSFNGSVAGWDLSSVTNMSEMFREAYAFTGTGVDSWDVSNVTDMSYMFDFAATFDTDISGWDVSNVTNMDFMLARTGTFLQDISGWDVSNVTSWDTFWGPDGMVRGDLERYDYTPPKFR